MSSSLISHRKYYHPSTSYIYLYGDIDMEEKLRWLDEKISRLSTGSMWTPRSGIRQPFTEMKEVVQEYSIASDEIFPIILIFPTIR